MLRPVRHRTPGRPVLLLPVNGEEMADAIRRRLTRYSTLNWPGEDTDRHVGGLQCRHDRRCLRERVELVGSFFA
jgi:hypothetical protein